MSKNIQIIYSKNLKRFSTSSDLNEPERVERYVFGLKVTNKYRNSLSMPIATIQRPMKLNGRDQS